MRNRTIDGTILEEDDTVSECYLRFIREKKKEKERKAKEQEAKKARDAFFDTMRKIAAERGTKIDY